jgi:hypothetical protein
VQHTLLHLIAITFVFGCGAALDAKSGGDHLPGKAKEIYIGKTHDDRISAPDGDHTDWKTFTLRSNATVVINAYWDNPKVESTVQVKNELRKQLYVRHHTNGQKENHWGRINLKAGEYYLQITANKGASGYTIEITSKVGGSDNDSIELPE